MTDATDWVVVCLPPHRLGSSCSSMSSYRNTIRVSGYTKVLKINFGNIVVFCIVVFVLIL